MYNKRKAGLEEAITTNGWTAYFEDELLPAGTRVGMYDVPRFAYAAAMFYNDLSPNLATTESLALAEETLMMREFAEWGDDTLKKGIAADNLDLAFVYTGDFLDTLYIQLGDNPDINDVLFVFIFLKTHAVVDELVIQSKQRNPSFAYN
jgi:spermidine/putrescine-binding protein